MTCSIPGCEKTAERRGWCQMHYRRWQRWGDPLLTHRPELVIGTTEERFWAKVDKNGPIPARCPELGPCWIWTGFRRAGAFDYGEFGRGGRAGGMVLAHIMSYELAHGHPVAEGLEISHLCDNPPCVNPAHLMAVTHGENLHYSPIVQWKMNAAKTHCKHGHEFTPANTIRRLRRDGGYSRQCRQCLDAAVARYQRRKRSEHSQAHG